MPILEMLSDEECALWAILSDPSGLDLAEFALIDEENEDSIFRAWAFQWAWWRCDDQRQIDQCSRSVGKSKSITVRALAFPFIHPGQEMVVTAPEGVHLDAVTGNIETMYDRCRLAREMIISGRTGVKHRPFQMNFANGSRIMGRIPQRDGKGMLGSHPIWLELDEGQSFPDPGWLEIIETLKMGSKGSVWRVHGVTRGIRDFFYKFTQPDSGWTIHQFTAMSRPTWNDKERQSKIEMYGSRDHPDYRRNILGQHGDASNPLFVLFRLMACVDQEQSSDYNQDEYTLIKINNEQVLDAGDDIIPLLAVPAAHRKFKVTWIGMDIGLTNHPSSIMVYAEEMVGKVSRLKLITRIMLERISNPTQVQAILWLIDFYRPKAFALDKTGIGLPMFQDIQGMAERGEAPHSVLDVIKGYGFSEKILVDFDQSIEVDEFRGDPVKESGMFRNVLEFSSDKCRELVDTKRMLLPWDKELIAEFQGSTWSYDKSQMDMYGRKKRFNAGAFHNLDATRMAILGFIQAGIEETQKKEKYEPVTDIFVTF